MGISAGLLRFRERNTENTSGKMGRTAVARSAAREHIPQSLLNGRALSCCSVRGGFLQFYSSISFDSARVCESLCTQHGQEDSPPPPLHLHRKRKRQAEVISRILLTLNINDLVACWTTVTYHCSSTTCERAHISPSLPFSQKHPRSSMFHFLSIVRHTCNDKLGHMHISYGTTAHRQGRGVG